MARVSVSTEVNFDFKVTPNLEGYYMKTEVDQGPKKNSSIHTFKTKEGAFINIWGSHVLDEKIMQREIGEYLYVDHAGMGKSKAGNEFHKFEVAFDDEIEPLDVNTKAPAAPVQEQAPQTGQGSVQAPAPAAKLVNEVPAGDDLPF